MEYLLTKEERVFLAEGLMNDLVKLREHLTVDPGEQTGVDGRTMGILLLTPMLMRLAGSLEGIVRRSGAIMDEAEEGGGGENHVHESPEEFRQLHDAIRSLTKTLRTLVRFVEKHSLTDPMTGMDNKKHFMAEGERLTSLLQRLNIPMSVLSFEVDELNRIQTQFGRKRGEELLLDTVRVVRGSIRRSDVMTRADKNRFCVIAPNAGGSNAMILAERLRRIMAGAGLLPSESGLALTLSIGVSGMGNGTQDATVRFHEALRRADAARRKARRSGHNQVILAGITRKQ